MTNNNHLLFSTCTVNRRAIIFVLILDEKSGESEGITRTCPTINSNSLNFPTPTTLRAYSPCLAVSNLLKLNPTVGRWCLLRQSIFYAIIKPFRRACESSIRTTYPRSFWNNTQKKRRRRRRTRWWFTNVNRLSTPSIASRIAANIHKERERGGGLWRWWRFVRERQAYLEIVVAFYVEFV